MKVNSFGIQALGQGIHALQDAIAHKGVKMSEHSVLNDISPSISDYIKAYDLTESAIILAEVISGNYNNLSNGMTLIFEGMTGGQLNTALNSIISGISPLPIKC